MDKNSDTNGLLARIDFLEQERRFIQEALETALSIGDFQVNIDKAHDVFYILREGSTRANQLIKFEASAIYLINPNTLDFIQSLCIPDGHSHSIEEDVNGFIEDGNFAWALREKRGIFLDSKIKNRKYFLHVISTYSRVKGIFVGMLPSGQQKIPDASFTLLSIILLNLANTLESKEVHSAINVKNLMLEKEIQERTKRLTQAERQLHQSQKIEAIGTLAGGIAHDFNNILSVIMGYTELAGLKLPKNSPVKMYLEKVLSGCLKAKDLIKQILCFSRQRELVLRPINIKSVLSASLKLIRVSLPSNIEIIQDIEKNTGVINCDPSLIHQVFVNLCANAADAMENGGTLTICLKNKYIDSDFADAHNGIQTGLHVLLKIEDNGKGMPKSVQDRIFEPYFTTKKHGGGSGLGMAVVHGIVKSHSGLITVESVYGKGSVFCVYFPVIEGVIPLESVHRRQIPPGHERILFVDDEQALVEINKEMLEQFGYKVDVRTSSVEALELFRSQPERFDLVITDLLMPNMTGELLAEKILKIRPDIPIILCTGFSDNVTEERIKKIGIRAFAMKPIVFENLSDIIRRIFD